MKESFTQTVQRYFAKKQKQVIIDGLIEQMTQEFEKQAYKLSRELYEKYNVSITLKEKKDGTLAIATVIHINGGEKD